MQGVPLYIVISRELNTGQSQNIKIGNSSFERAEEFKYLGTTLIKILFRKKLREDGSKECLLSFGTESSIFHFAVQKYTD